MVQSLHLPWLLVIQFHYLRMLFDVAHSLLVVLFGCWILKKCLNPEPDFQFDSPFLLVILRKSEKKFLRSLRCQPGFLTSGFSSASRSPRETPPLRCIGSIDGGFSWIPSAWMRNKYLKVATTVRKLPYSHIVTIYIYKIPIDILNDITHRYT
jgi:hypothetical protein